ncbi:hypothetical protein PINS_up021379 [Pythium insidiosum]|nr:hypothetical protein PINS_up021379 [Pythium insidiosum]
MATQQQGSDGATRNSKKPSPADFMFGTTLGEGAYARVVHARMKETGVECSPKVSHDRIVKLYFTFQDNNYLYMVMELCRGGELLDVITKHQKEQAARGIKDRACSLELTRFYIAEVVVALEYLHNSGVIHRDLKPENILLSDSGHIKVTDFGTAKDESEEHRSNTFCGTAEFVSPEVLRDHEAFARVRPVGAGVHGVPDAGGTSAVPRGERVPDVPADLEPPVGGLSVSGRFP